MARFDDKAKPLTEAQKQSAPVVTRKRKATKKR